MSRLLPSLRRLRALAPLSGVVLLGSCRAASLAYGPDLASARTNAESVASAMEQRFTNVLRQPKFLNARMRMARYALAPSALVGDTALWTDMRSTVSGAERTTERTAERTLEVAGAMTNGRYVFTPRARTPLPTRTGDSRHLIALRQLNTADDWQWTTGVDHAIGPMPPSRADDIMRALFLSAERPSGVIRADYRAALPRTATAFGRLVAVDSIVTTAQADGSTLVALHLLISDQHLTPTMPALAKFVRQYIAPARYHIRLSDRTGGDWFDAQAGRSRLVLRFRSRGGELQPLVGAARRMPDSLTVTVDGSAKFGLFTVGASRLVGDFVHVTTPLERSWSMRFTHEPAWDLPLLAEQLLHAPLARPFEGGGVQVRLGFVRGPEGQTMLSRTIVLATRESAIMRFLGNLGFTAMSDYAGTVEDEENRFLAEGFGALRRELAELRP